MTNREIACFIFLFFSSCWERFKVAQLAKQGTTHLVPFAGNFLR